MYIYHISETEIKFSNGKNLFELTYEHEQDCCEEVYADFESITKRILNKKGKDVSIYTIDFNEEIETLVEEVKDQGFMLCAKDGTKVLVNCYDIQNGWYNSDLAIILYKADKIGTLNLNQQSIIHEDK